MKIYLLIVDDSLDSLNLLDLMNSCELSKSVNNQQNNQNFILKPKEFDLNLDNIIMGCSSDSILKGSTRERRKFVSVVKTKNFSQYLSKNLKWIGKTHFKRA